MNAAEIKLDLFRRIDKLPKAELERIYEKVLAIINTTSKYKLSEQEKNAINEAISESGKKNLQNHADVVAEASKRYPNLKFK